MKIKGKQINNFTTIDPDSKGLVDAEGELDATKKALEEAGDFEFSEQNAEYEVDYVEEA